MANICDNTIIFYGESEKISKAYQSMQNFYEKNHRDRTLYDYAVELGWEKKQIPVCRGDITYINDIECDEYGMHQYTLDSETAWQPVNEYWDMIAKHFGINYVSSSSEPSSNIFIIHNDKEKQFFPDNYIVDIWETNVETGLEEGIYEFCKNKAAVKTFLNEKSGKRHSYQEWESILDENCCGRICEFVRD